MILIHLLRAYINSNTIFFHTGNIETKSEALDTISRNVALRNELDLFVNVVECRSYPEVPSRHKDISIAVVRQNTEGEYAMLEHEVNNCLIYQNVFNVLMYITSYFRAYQELLKV